MIYELWILGILIVCAITDLKERKVVTVFCFANSAIALVVHLIARDVLWLNILLGMILGAAFYLVSIMTKGSIGKGDAIVIFTVGSIIGIEEVFEMLVWALILCSVFAIIGMLIKRCTLKTRLPLVPFMLLGEIVRLIV